MFLYDLRLLRYLRELKLSVGLARNLDHVICDKTLIGNDVVN